MSHSPLNANQPHESLHLLPNQIQTQARYNVRPFASEATESEDRLIEELAASIEAVGQLDPVILSPEHVLIAGHRRRKAIIVINDRRSQCGQSLLRVHCHVNHDGGDLRQKSIISNLHRRELSAMDLAYLIAQIRKEQGWVGWQGTKKVAKYLHVNEATIYTTERLLSIEKDIQNKVHDRTISVQSAFELIKAEPSSEERAAILKRAGEIQAEEKLERTLANHENGRRSLSRTIDEITRIGNPENRIERPALVAAIRERHTVTPKKIALNRPELLKSIAQFDADSYSETARSFARYWVNVYAKGEGTEQELRAKFAAIQPDSPGGRKPVQTAAMAS